MDKLTLDQANKRVQPLLEADETIRQCAIGQSKPPLWMFLLAPLALVLALVIGLGGAQAGIVLGLIEPGPMMPLVGIPLALVVLVPYFVLLSRGFTQFDVCLTNHRLLIANISKADSKIPLRSILQSDWKGITAKTGLGTPLVVQGLTIAFPWNIRGNKEQSAAIAKVITGK